VDGVEWLVITDESTGLAMYRTGQFDAGPGLQWNVRQPDGALYGPYMPNQLRNRGHVNDPKLAAMVQEQRRLKDTEARKQLVFAIQRYAAEQQYYVYLSSQVVTASWQPYVKIYTPNLNSASAVASPPCGWIGRGD
jgi:ABC-type transport system substrate-binding protein